MFQLSQDRRSFLKSFGLLSASTLWMTGCKDISTVDPNLAIACWGDSLTAGVGGKPYTHFLEKAFPTRAIKNFSITRQTAQQIAARQGSLPLTLSVEGNAFKEEQALKVTSLSTELLSTGATNKTFTLKGKIQGTTCFLTRKATGSYPNQTEVYTLAPFTPSIQPIPPNSVFIPEEADLYRSSFQIFWMGRNDTPNFTGIDILLDNCIEYLSNTDHFLVLGVLSGLTEIVGTPTYIKTIAFNEILKAKYKDHYVSVSPPAPEEMNAVSYKATSKDISEISRGVFPSGLRADNIHLNAKGYEVMANRIIYKLKDLGMA